MQTPAQPDSYNNFGYRKKKKPGPDSRGDETPRPNRPSYGPRRDDADGEARKPYGPRKPYGQRTEGEGEGDRKPYGPRKPYGDGNRPVWKKRPPEDGGAGAPE